MLLVAAVVLCCQAVASAGDSATAWARGVVFGGDEWTSPETGYGTAASLAALTALSKTGATHVRLLTSRYQDTRESTTIYPLDAPSPLATTPDADLISTIAQARALNLSVFLCPVLDPNWDIITNARSSSPLFRYPNNATFVWRGMIGQGFSDAQWAAWFASYTAWVVPLAQLAEAHGVAWLGIASELDLAFTREAEWRAVVGAVRRVFSGALLIEYGLSADLAWWDALDYIGVDFYESLGGNLSLGVAPTVPALQAALAPHVAKMAALSTRVGKRVVITEIGYQSRPSCHVRPFGTLERNPQDDSPWLCSFDLLCQANAYEAFLSTLTPQPWFAGVFWWLWHADPTSGGSSDSDFTPHGKPAELVLRRWYNRSEAPTAAGDGRADIVAALIVQAQHEEARLHDDDDAVASPAPHGSTSQDSAQNQGRVTRRQWQGWVLGGPDFWSNPAIRLDSADAQQSLDNMVGVTGADSVEIVVEWYTSSPNDTAIYPVLDPHSPLATSSDAELAAMLRYARSKGLKTVLTPMIDLEMTRPELAWCYSDSPPPRPNNCGWRGEFGQSWGEDCSAGSSWATWWGTYSAFIMRYAVLAAQENATAFLVQHELYTAAKNCPQRWEALIAAVRGVYAGQVSAAFFGDILTPEVQARTGYVRALDWLGVDCYSGPGSGLPATAWGNTSYPHPLLPWQDYSLDTLVAAKRTLMPAYRATAAWAGKSIVCTEVGWEARPWAWGDYSGIHQLCGEDCSVVSQCAALPAQALAYQAFLATFYDPVNTWFEGALFWLWRADPTAGGGCDAGFSVMGKPAAAVVARAWGPRDDRV